MVEDRAKFLRSTRDRYKHGSDGGIFEGTCAIMEGTAIPVSNFVPSSVNMSLKTLLVCSAWHLCQTLKIQVYAERTVGQDTG
jgi:hypothetical protein